MWNLLAPDHHMHLLLPGLLRGLPRARTMMMMMMMTTTTSLRRSRRSRRSDCSLADVVQLTDEEPHGQVDEAGGLAPTSQATVRYVGSAPVPDARAQNDAAEQQPRRRRVVHVHLRGLTVNNKKTDMEDELRL